MHPVPRRFPETFRLSRLTGRGRLTPTERVTASRADRPPQPRQTRILIVDDHEDTARLMGELLTALGHSVALAHSGATALDTAIAFDPHVALLDLRLPGMDGYELAWRLRSQLGERLRLIAVTGFGPGSDRERSARAGFEAYLVKPVTLDQLQSALRAD